MVERCLVTGADGFIGSVLCRRLGTMGVRVYRLVHRRPGVDTIVADLGRDLVIGLEAIQPEAVFHLAGRVHKRDQGSHAAAEHMRVTVEGTRSLLQAAIAANARVFVFFSTCAVMAEGSSEELDESARPMPTTDYGRAKLQAEELVLSMNGMNGMKTVCLRLPLVYGPGHKGNLPQMIKAIERGLFPPLPDFGGRRSLLHVDDAVDAALLVAQASEAAGKVYFLAEPRSYSSREIYEVVLKALGRRPPRWHVPGALLVGLARIGDVGGQLARRRMPFDSKKLDKLSQSAWYSAGRIERELGFTASRSFESTVPQLVTRAPK
jgi:UDP-glucose 4-epimerase